MFDLESQETHRTPVLLLYAHLIEAMDYQQPRLSSRDRDIDDFHYVLPLSIIQSLIQEYKRPAPNRLIACLLLCIDKILSAVPNLVPTQKDRFNTYNPDLKIGLLMLLLRQLINVENQVNLMISIDKETTTEKLQSTITKWIESICIKKERSNEARDKRFNPQKWENLRKRLESASKIEDLNKMKFAVKQALTQTINDFASSQDWNIFNFLLPRDVALSKELMIAIERINQEAKSIRKTLERPTLLAPALKPPSYPPPARPALSTPAHLKPPSYPAPTRPAPPAATPAAPTTPGLTR